MIVQMTHMGHFLLGFLGPIILLCLVLSLCLVYHRVLPSVRLHFLAKMDSSEEACRQADIFLACKQPLYSSIVNKISLTSRVRNMWSLNQAGLGSSSSSSWSICPQKQGLQPLSLGPIDLLPTTMYCSSFVQNENENLQSFNDSILAALTLSLIPCLFIFIYKLKHRSS